MFVYFLVLQVFLKKKFFSLQQLPVITSNTIVRCRSCRTYINPFVSFLDQRRWKCNLCYRVNDGRNKHQQEPMQEQVALYLYTDLSALLKVYIFGFEGMIVAGMCDVLIFVPSVSQFLMSSCITQSRVPTANHTRGQKCRTPPSSSLPRQITWCVSHSFWVRDAGCTSVSVQGSEFRDVAAYKGRENMTGMSARL